MNDFNNFYRVLRARVPVTELLEDGATSSSLDNNDPADSDHRIIHIHKLPTQVKYIGNRICTAKYRLLDCIPLFLFEQFRRWANLFILAIALLQQIPDVSLTGRYTTLLPLIFILSVSAIKEIAEDIKRRRADDEVNRQKVEVLRGESWAYVKWMDVIVGDIVKVKNNQMFPADLLLISSSEPQGMSLIETANLDGETNLKMRQALPMTSTYQTISTLCSFQGTIECAHPNEHLYEFNGVLKEYNKVSLPLGPNQLLLRGEMLRNTSWICGVVIYTGHETKLTRNSIRAPLKRSTVDKLTNRYVFLLFCILVIMCVICFIFNENWSKQHSITDWYIGLGDISQYPFYNFLSFIILFNNLIPASLQGTLEIVRLIQAYFINMDREMYYPETDTPAIARASNLNEELGQVKYIFTDKTGTLTRNVMEFKGCAVGNEVYFTSDTVEGSLLVRHIHEKHENADLIRDLLVLLSVCHTVIPEKLPDGSIVYHATSPDERALVYGAMKYGYIFESRTPTSVQINALGTVEKYEILNVLEFTSSRKRMSIIVRDPNGKLKLFCKGADSVIYERLKGDNLAFGDILIEHLKQFAMEGLRTLCCAVTELKETDYEIWKEIYHTAACSLHEREEKMDEAANLIENDLKLIGATAIEDKLQDGVPETIAALLKADISVWVLTGDMKESAINISYSCHLIDQEMPLIVLNEETMDNAREYILKMHAELGENLGKQNEIALIVDGKTLKYTLSCKLRTDFLKLCISCKVVICCRVSPLQKAEVVEYIRKYTKSITLAIGDGVNDVAMIQKAHIGVGISGIEGSQAASASDYSIAQFRFLLRLLLVHGVWSYSRICKLILYSFYKNICLYTIELWFAIYSGWSGQILFESSSIGLYNIVFTALPPLAIGLFDTTCKSGVMLQNPKLYKPSQNGQLFNIKVFWIWVINGFMHSASLFWLPFLLCQYDIMWMNGKNGGYLVLGNYVYTFVVVTVCLKAGLVINSWVWPTHIAIWGSVSLWFIYVIIYSHVWPILPIGSVMAGMNILLFSSAAVWLGFILIPIIVIIPDFTAKVIYGTVSKVERERLDLSRKPKKLPRRPQKMMLLSGFAFSQEEGGSVSQAELIRAYDTNFPKPDGN